jgi:hypothetical protein
LLFDVSKKSSTHPCTWAKDPIQKKRKEKRKKEKET